MVQGVGGHTGVAVEDLHVGPELRSELRLDERLGGRRVPSCGGRSGGVSALFSRNKSLF